MILYKYRTINQFSLDIIKNKRLFLAKASTLNDPYDVLIKNVPTLYELEMFYNEAFYDDTLGLGASSTLVYNVEDELEKFRICSLSSKNDSVLMWSHYSNSHKGIVFEIEIEETKVHMINYQEENSFFKITEEFIEKLRNKNVTVNDWVTYYSYKVKEWEYEDEYRIIENGKIYAENLKVTCVILGNNYLDNNLEGLILLKEILTTDVIKIKKINIGIHGKEIIELKLEDILTEINNKMTSILR
jgi:hypothetical protein